MGVRQEIDKKTVWAIPEMASFTYRLTVTSAEILS
jgi:hypothetical protein